jgi:hypothetical protein
MQAASTLAESFLADLDDLSEEEEEDLPQEESEHNENVSTACSKSELVKT